jgi:hypothetical protein
MPDTTFASLEAATFWRYISSTLDRLAELAITVEHDGLHWRPPTEDANSIAVLAVHTLWNAEENIIQTLCGTPAGRTRDEEFVVRPVTADDVRDHWADLRPRLEAALAQLTTADLDGDRSHPRRGVIKGREVLIVVARHTAEHLGQAELTRDLYNATR